MRPWQRWLGVWLLLGAGMSHAVAAQEASSAKTTTKTKDGLHFNLPHDWPVEKRDGVVAPIPVEEYLAKKFGGLDSRLRAVEDQLNSLDLRLRVLEEQFKKQRRLESGESTQGTVTVP